MGKVYVKSKLPRMVPWDWTGFVSLDLLILYDTDWNAFKPNQLEAISQWVSNGGKLLIVFGSHPIIDENPIAKLLPFEIQQAKEITVSTDKLKSLGLNGDNLETVISWPIKAKPNARFCNTETEPNSQCLFATGYVGFGRVGVLAFDPSTMTEIQKTNSGQFWVDRISAILTDTQAKPVKLKTTKKARRSRARAGRGERLIYHGNEISSNRNIIFIEDDNHPDLNGNNHQFNTISRHHHHL